MSTGIRWPNMKNGSLKMPVQCSLFESHDALRGENHQTSLARTLRRLLLRSSGPERIRGYLEVVSKPPIRGVANAYARSLCPSKLPSLLSKRTGAGNGSTTYSMSLEDKPKLAEAKISRNFRGICDIVTDTFEDFEQVRCRRQWPQSKI